jgi:chorismate mutase
VEWRVRGIRGAITVSEDTPQAISEGVKTLLGEIQRRNEFSLDEVAGVFFTTTPDLTSAFPATFAREIGWEVPFLGGVEMAVPGAPPRCIRVLILVNTTRRPEEMHHVYLNDARLLRPDL